MRKVFIALENEYISAWSNDPLASLQEIQTTDDLIGLLGCVKVVDGVAVLDKEKQEHLKKEQAAINEQPDKIEALIARQNLTEATVLELADMLLS